MLHAARLNVVKRRHVAGKRPKRTARTNGAVLFVADAAQWLGFTEKALRQCVARRRLPFHRLGRRVYFLRDELDSCLREQAGCTLDEARATARNP
jgi:excisionase family DNA binding protein